MRGPLVNNCRRELYFHERRTAIQAYQKHHNYKAPAQMVHTFLDRVRDSIPVNHSMWRCHVVAGSHIPAMFECVTRHCAVWAAFEVCDPIGL